MPDDPKQVEAARKAYAEARAKSESGRTDLIRANETVKRLERAGAGDHELLAAKMQAASLQQTWLGHEGAKAQTLAAFAAFTNPINAVSLLPDDTPMALFPLRLETRYRTIAGKRVFCVRAFPDDVLVDTFQPEIAEIELASVTNYWVHYWRAAGDPAGRRAAWAALVRSSGAGRAKWLLDQVKPVNSADEPGPGPHVLVIVHSAPVPDQGHVAKFWARVWSTSGGERDEAFADLATAVGNARATEIETTLEPANLRDVTVKPVPGADPRVVFLELPPRETLPLSQAPWLRGARAWLLPERLVLLGFRDGKKVLEEVGQPIPADLQIGPDPAAQADQQLEGGAADLKIPDPLRWTVDFDEAVQKGMAFAVKLADGPLPRFDRLFILGVRVGSDATEGAEELSRLIANHQSSRKGFSILPQGRATNNTDAANAGYSWWEDPDESYRHFFEIDPNDDPMEWELRKDGAWLAGMLGIDRAVLKGSPNYYGTDQAEARAMNAALWPATLGYYMEQMMEPVFSDDTVRDTRAFFNRFVLGRGTVPLVRVGRQPYGILPTTVWSRLSFWESGEYIENARLGARPDVRYLNDLFELTKRAAALWRGQAENVANAAEPGDDPQQTLLRIIGLHPTSAEFYQRYARTFTHYHNQLQFSHVPAAAAGMTAAVRRYIEAGLLALSELGWTMPSQDELPELLEKIFLRKANLLKGPLVQAELSDKAPLAVTRTDGFNYIAWLQQAARTSHDALRRQDGFANGVPEALLYQMLRHALDLGFIDAALTFRRSALQLSDDAYRAERREPKSIHVGAQQGGSRWASLYRPEPAVTKDPGQHLGDYIAKALDTRNPYLATQVAALDVLKNATSGALERAFVEHLDCLTYRLDAWRLGVHAVQLSHMRDETPQGFGRGGIYIGAYGWLEDVEPKAQTLEPVQLEPELAKHFDTPGAPPLVRDSTNFGHIHAPSLDHAVTAAILRNGHLANATPEAPDLLAVDLTSERVRLAQQVIDGIRNGQSLGALLGYRLERALHDEPNLFLDRIIYDLRRAFPLAGNRNLRTKVPALAKITKVEARNVVDGAAFLDHLDETAITTYPYGVAGLPPLSEFTGPGLPTAAQIGARIDGHVAQLRSVADAVADLQIAEGVYQVVRGNYDRASGTLDAFSKGAPPPVPEVVTTPRNGRALTHRIALHLQGGLLPNAPANTTPRAKAEPALARWIEGQLPDPSTIFARVSWPGGSVDVNMTQLGLGAIDLFYMLDAGGDRDMPGFDDLLIDFAERSVAAPRHDAVFTLEYKPAGVAGLTLFEVAPLVRALRGLVLGTRPLRSADLALKEQDDGASIVRVDKAQSARNGVNGTLAAIQPFITAIETAAGEAVDPVLARDHARDHIDQWLLDYATIVRPVVPFGLQAASLTTGVEGRRAPFEAMRKALAEIIDRWQKKAVEYDAVLAKLPAAANDEERTALLIRAGRVVSRTIIEPVPPVPALQAQVAGLRATFDTALADLIAIRDNATKTGALLVAFTGFVPTYDSIDQTPLHLTPFRDSVLALARDLKAKAEFLRDDVTRRVADADKAIARVATATGDKKQLAAADAAKAILGDAFILLPEFTLPSARLAGWDVAWTNRAQLLAHLTRPFPLEDWRIGVARVRERVRHLELATLLGEALGATKALTLDAVQFPFTANDAWLGLELPLVDADGKPFAIKEDKLLYSPHFAPGAEIDPTDPARTYSGLLLDEWVEVVPTDEVTSGLAFHFDRPGSEAPQAVLLVTPPVQQGMWQWQDLVDTLHETLDFARLRAVEPAQLDKTALGPLLPAVISAVTLYPITAALNLAFNNGIHRTLAK